jgi:S1-C subfamily serine protease
MIRAARALPLLLAALASLPAGAEAAPARAGGALCTGRYADTLAAMNAAARTRESRPAADYAYCLRAKAVYESVSWGRGGKLRRQYHTKVRHGTGFAYRQRGGEWLVATNDHVVAFPEVTGDGVDVDGVPPGARRVREEIRIVGNEAEPDGPGQIPLRDVVRDEALDVAVLASRQALNVLPYKLGRSADLRVGNAVLARGFPLGAFPAANAGKVIGVGQRDTDRGWDHEDFAVDALLNLGSSGSPVLAVSCETGEPEVVGIYHAGYRGAQGLNVVVAIDGLRGVLEGLAAPARAAAPAWPGGADPAEARAALSAGPIVMPFGGRAVRVEREGEAIRFGLLDPGFPLSERVELLVLDRGAPATGRAAELRAALWEQLGLVLRYRAAEAGRGGARSAALRERIAARLRERDEDQVELLAALRAGVEGLGVVTYGEGGLAAREPAGQAAPADAVPVLVIGSRPSP